MQHIVRDSTRRCQLDQALVLSLNVWLHSSPPFLITTSKSWIPPRGKRQKVEGIRPHPIPCPLQLITHSSQYHFGIQFNSKPTLPIPLLLIFFCCFRTDTEKEKADHPHVYINEKTKRKEKLEGETPARASHAMTLFYLESCGSEYLLYRI